MVNTESSRTTERKLSHSDDSQDFIESSKFSRNGDILLEDHLPRKKNRLPRKKFDEDYVVVTDNESVSDQGEENLSPQTIKEAAISNYSNLSPPIMLKYSKRNTMGCHKSENTSINLKNNKQHSNGHVSQLELSITRKTSSLELPNKTIVYKDNVEASADSNLVSSTSNEKSSKKGNRASCDVGKNRSSSKHYQRRNKGKDPASATGFPSCVLPQGAGNVDMNSGMSLNNETSLQYKLASCNGNSTKISMPSETDPACGFVKSSGSVGHRRSKHKRTNKVPELKVDQQDFFSYSRRNNEATIKSEICSSKEEATLTTLEKVHIASLNASGNYDEKQMSMETNKVPEIIDSCSVTYKRHKRRRRGKKRSCISNADQDILMNANKGKGGSSSSQKENTSSFKAENDNEETGSLRCTKNENEKGASNIKGLKPSSHKDKNSKLLSSTYEGVSLIDSPTRGVFEDFSSLNLLVNRKNLLETYEQECVQDRDMIVTESDTNISQILGESAGSIVSVNLIKNSCQSKPVHSGADIMTNHAKEDFPFVTCAEKNVSSEVIERQEKKLDLVPRNVLSHQRRKLLVLDINGLLADINQNYRNAHKSHIRVGGKGVFKRPFCNDFLQFCFERFNVGIWSSRRKYNVESVVNHLMGNLKYRLLFCWDQSRCTDTGFRTLENKNKPLVLKELRKLWDNEENDLPWEKGDYSPSNTLLVDDSPYKAIRNPPHTAIFPYPYHFGDKDDKSLGPGGDLRCYLEGLAMADDVQGYVQEHPFGQNAISDSNPSWKFYLQIIDTMKKSLASIR